MDGLGDRVFYWVNDETNISILLFVAVAVLGGASLILFVVSKEKSVTQLEFLLLISAMIIMFYMTIRNSTF
ncbi:MULTISPECIES: hypothetical protein [unclassified Haladaptatus]|uniref:hypothetical protein n=1 Tax=unclassified Haladaptatus TaxID=2622732 RepID=UPI00209C0A9B|nr:MULTISPECIES: hypothetical protein [unclassified Haladaptatus]MCO8246992.1 hypothetical protein [Haladaptatus sp. AB643]MCO8254625.1 hypothetical protein [Haladaptatus sp. AB618]